MNLQRVNELIAHLQLKPVENAALINFYQSKRNGLVMLIDDDIRAILNENHLQLIGYAEVAGISRSVNVYAESMADFEIGKVVLLMKNYVGNFIKVDKRYWSNRKEFYFVN